MKKDYVRVNEKLSKKSSTHSPPIQPVGVSIDASCTPPKLVINSFYFSVDWIDESPSETCGTVYVRACKSSDLSGKGGRILLSNGSKLENRKRQTFVTCAGSTVIDIASFHVPSDGHKVVVATNDLALLCIDLRTCTIQQRVPLDPSRFAPLTCLLCSSSGSTSSPLVVAGHTTGAVSA